MDRTEGMFRRPDGGVQDRKRFPAVCEVAGVFCQLAGSHHVVAANAYDIAQIKGAGRYGSPTCLQM